MISSNTKYFLLLIFFGSSGLLFLSAYGDGLASETLPPEMIGNMSVTLSINSTPFSIDIYHTGTEMNFFFIDADNQQPLPDVTISISAFKGDKALFGHIFKSDSGNFLIDTYPQESGNISINEQGAVFSGLLDQHSGKYDIKGPIFNSGGLYRFKINVLTIGSYDNQISKSYNAAISIPETDQYQIYDKDYGNQNVTVIAYYDQINNFHYNSEKKSINFTMPFDWSDSNINNVSVVHQELKIPKTFGNFLVTKYDSYINGIKLPDNAVTIDDYSSDDRIVHLILYKQELSNLATKQQTSKTEMYYSLLPSNETGFPILQFTRNAQFKISLSWDPPKITAGSDTKFNFKILDPYLTNRTVSDVGYDFSIIANHKPIFQKSGVTSDSDTGNTITAPIPANATGPITISFENIKGNSFAGAEMSSVISNPTRIPEFPFSSLIILVITFSSIILFSKLRQFR
jgi:predicted secreted protein with PEFG-CTERM motif